MTRRCATLTNLCSRACTLSNSTRTRARFSSFFFDSSSGSFISDSPPLVGMVCDFFLELAALATYNFDRRKPEHEHRLCFFWCTNQISVSKLHVDFHVDFSLASVFILAVVPKQIFESVRPC